MEFIKPALWIVFVSVILSALIKVEISIPAKILIACLFGLLISFHFHANAIMRALHVQINYPGDQLDPITYILFGIMAALAAGLTFVIVKYWGEIIHFLT